MSMRLMVQAMKIKVGSSARKLVLLKLADNANDEGECWPSYSNISAQTEMSERSVMRHVLVLESAGMVEIIRRPNQSNLFKLKLDDFSGENLSRRGDKNDNAGVTNCQAWGDKNNTQNQSVESVNESVNESGDAKKVFDHWNATKIIEHRDIKPHLKSIGAKLNNYTAEEICLAIDNYKAVLETPDTFLNYKWSLKEFLSKPGNIDRFMDRVGAFKSYLKSSNGNGYKSQADINSASSGKVVL